MRTPNGYARMIHLTPSPVTITVVPRNNARTPGMFGSIDSGKAASEQPPLHQALVIGCSRSNIVFDPSDRRVPQPLRSFWRIDVGACTANPVFPTIGNHSHHSCRSRFHNNRLPTSLRQGREHQAPLAHLQGAHHTGTVVDPKSRALLTSGFASFCVTQPLRDKR
ncbi:uncharacterized protein CANTADRAFT_251385 [Suhomyces tanzawaensis NRRL Y-17324]|uniref:Uncharacterized protein n=1 Tax=Suhomyces tanzawaensis NRRL Y-17324 TaxID=984487 RepID=A0A1E4SIC4_9ASCO|nr:uncharacterized protein CANTADRAFT_251385 [Suhomyces tanzawaensis NRRL Y-17324]ODV79268.1 hypothetical protein CANTADRAFT_251385 [Suhomyces tanzawaensis NRRL Y-17324]